MINRSDRGYVRVSTQKESQKDSPEHQEALIREYAARENTIIDHVYEDRDSATSIIARDDVQRMIQDAKRGEISSIWFASLSRFSRDALDALSLKRILVNALRVRVVSIEDGYDSAVKDDEVMFGVKSVMNQNQSEQISVSSRRGIRQSAQRGNYTGSIAPYGYKKVTVDKRKTLEIVPEQAEVVKMIFEMYNGHQGEKAIVNFLNGDDGKRAAIPSYRGGLWGISSIQRILQNENYTGYNTFGRHTTEVTYNDLSDLMNRGKKLVQKPKSEWEKSNFQTHEAIISKDIFNRAQEVRLLRGGGERGGRRVFTNVFAKLVFCSECGSAMVSSRPVVRGKGYQYLICSRRRRVGKTGCANDRWIRYEEIRDELISRILEQAKLRVKALQERGLREMVAAAIEGDYAKDKRKLTKTIDDNRRLLFEIRRQHMLKDINDAQYEFEKAQYEKEIESTELRLAGIQAREAIQLDTEKLVKEMDEALIELTSLKTYDNVEKTRGLLMKLVKRIDIDAAGEIAVQPVY